MSTVAEIENALQKLAVEDAWKVADWLQHYLDEKWDTQIDADIDAGRLDKLADKAIEDYRARRVKPRTRFPAPARNPSDDRNRSAGECCRSLRTDDAKRSSLQNRAGHRAITTLQFRSSRWNAGETAPGA